LKQALDLLRAAGCKHVYVDGSFVTSKERPNDIDVCWDVHGVDVRNLEPVFLDFSNQRAAQKARFMSEFFPADLPEGVSGRTFLEFFQIEKNTGNAKGIILLDLEELA